MKIAGAYWTPQVNVLRIKCSCGNTFDHRSDRWKVRCPQCEQHAGLGDLRDYYVKEGFAMTDGAAEVERQRSLTSTDCMLDCPTCYNLTGLTCHFIQQPSKPITWRDISAEVERQRHHAAFARQCNPEGECDKCFKSISGDEAKRANDRSETLWFCDECAGKTRILFSGSAPIGLG